MLNKIETSESCSIPFKWMDDTPGGSNLGHCEFAFVLNFGRKNKISSFYVFLLQHRNVKSYLHYKGGDIDFVISSYDKLEDAKTWMVHKSEEPKGTCLHVYTPRHSSYLWVDYHGVNFTKSPIGKIIDLTK